MDTRTKILGRKELAKRLNEHKSRGEEIVLTNGCFDILHVGHSRYLTGAKSEGDILVVAVNSDESVRSLKGEGRPILPAEARAEIVAALAAVDYVVIFEEQDTRKGHGLYTRDRARARDRGAIGHTSGYSG
jgi:rfaE bifunctional protein nucleotidyltransferase chain/domain